MVTGRRVFRSGRSAFRFDATDVITLKDPSPALILDTVSKKTASIHYEPLEGAAIDHTGLIAQGACRDARFSHYGFGRLCGALDIPRRFINSLSKENSPLAAKVVNDRIRSKGKGFMLAMDGEVAEGIVSDRYTRLENYKVAEMAAELTNGSFNKLSLEGLRMRLSNIGDEEFTPHTVGDIVKGGIDIYNGEDGGAAFNVSAYIYRLVCSNGMVAPKEESLGRVIHRGSGLRERAMVLIQRSQDLCVNYLEKLPRATKIELNNLEQREMAGSIQKAFSLMMANATFEKAVEEAEGEGHGEVLTLYNLFNGMTFQAHEAKTLDKTRAIETFAARLLDEGLKIAA